MKTTNRIIELFKEFNSLKEITGTSKISSFSLTLYFDPWEDKVNLDWGCYDVGDLPRHYITDCKLNELEKHMEEQVKFIKGKVYADNK